MASVGLRLRDSIFRKSFAKENYFFCSRPSMEPRKLLTLLLTLMAASSVTR